MGGSGEAVERPLAQRQQHQQQQQQQQPVQRSSSSSNLLGSSYHYPVSLLRARTQLPQLQGGADPAQQQHQQHEDHVVVQGSPLGQAGSQQQQQLLLQSTLLQQEGRASVTKEQQLQAHAGWRRAGSTPTAAAAATTPAAFSAAAAAALAGPDETIATDLASAPAAPSAPDSPVLARDSAAAAAAAAPAAPDTTAAATAASKDLPALLQHAAATAAAAAPTVATTATEADAQSPAADAAGTPRGEHLAAAAEAAAAEAAAATTAAAAAGDMPYDGVADLVPLQHHPSTMDQQQHQLQQLQQQLQQQAAPLEQQHQQQQPQEQPVPLQQQQQSGRAPLPVPTAPPPQICLIGSRLLAMRSPWGLSTSAVLQRNGISDLMLYLAMLQSLLLPARWAGLMPLGAADCPAAAASLPAAAAAAVAAEAMALSASALDACGSPPPAQGPWQQQQLLLLLRRFLQQLPTPADGSSGLTLLNGLYRHLRTAVQKQQQQQQWNSGSSLVAQAAAAAAAAAEEAAVLGLQGEESTAWPAVAAATAAVEATAAAAAAAAASAAVPGLYSFSPLLAEGRGSPPPMGDPAAGCSPTAATVAAAAAATAAAGLGEVSTFEGKRREALRQLGRLLACPPVLVVFDIYPRSTTRSRSISISGSITGSSSSQMRGSSSVRHASGPPRGHSSSASALSSNGSSSSDSSSSGCSLAAEFGEAFGWQILEFCLTDVGAPPLQSLVDFCSSLRFWLQLDRHLNLSIVNVHPKSGCGALLLLAAAAMACSSSSGAAAWGSQHQLLKMLASASLAAQDCSLTSSGPKATTGSSSSSSQRGGGVLHWKPPDRWPPSCRRYLSYFECLLRHGSGAAAREEGLQKKALAGGVETRVVRLKNILVDHFAAPAAFVAVEVYELATCCCCCSGCCRRPPPREPCSLLLRHQTSGAAKAATFAAGATGAETLPFLHSSLQSASSSNVDGFLTAETPQQQQQQQQQDGGSRVHKRGLASYLSKQRGSARAKHQSAASGMDDAHNHPYLQALRQQARMCTDSSTAAAAAAAAIEGACSPNDLPLLMDPGGPLGHLGACCEAYVSLPVSAPCLTGKALCCCPPVTGSTQSLSAVPTSDEAAAADVSPSFAGGDAEELLSPTAEAVAAAAEGDREEAAAAAERVLLELQQRQKQQHLQQRRLQQQHQRELHAHYSLQACAADYQLMAAYSLPVRRHPHMSNSTLQQCRQPDLQLHRSSCTATVSSGGAEKEQDGSISAVFDFAHARDGTSRHLFLSGDVLIAIRQLAPRVVPLRPAAAAAPGIKKQPQQQQQQQQELQQQHVYALYSFHTGIDSQLLRLLIPCVSSAVTQWRGSRCSHSRCFQLQSTVIFGAAAVASVASGFLPPDQSVVELHVGDFDSSTPLSQRLRVSLIFEHQDTGSSSCSSNCSSNRSSTSSASRCCTSSVSGSLYSSAAPASTDAAASPAAVAAAAAGTPPDAAYHEAEPPSGKSPAGRSLVGELMSSLLRWQQPRESSSQPAHPQQQQQQQLVLPQHSEARISRRPSSCSVSSTGEAPGAALSRPSPQSGAAAAAAAAAAAGSACTHRCLHVTKRPAASRRDFAARHCLQIDPRLLVMLVEASGCSSDSCAVALKLCSNDFSMALSLVSYYFAAAGGSAAAAIHATRLLQQALPPPWLQQQHLLHRQLAPYLQLKEQQQQQQQQQELDALVLAADTVGPDLLGPETEQQQQQRQDTLTSGADSKAAVVSSSQQQEQQQQQAFIGGGAGADGTEGHGGDGCFVDAGRRGFLMFSAGTAPQGQQQQLWGRQQQQQHPLLLQQQQMQRLPAARSTRIAPVPLRPGQSRRAAPVVVSPTATAPAAAACRPAAAQQQQLQQQQQSQQQQQQSLSKGFFSGTCSLSVASLPGSRPPTSAAASASSTPRISSAAGIAAAEEAFAGLDLSGEPQQQQPQQQQPPQQRQHERRSQHPETYEDVVRQQQQQQQRRKEEWPQQQQQPQPQALDVAPGGAGSASAFQLAEDSRGIGPASRAVALKEVSPSLFVSAGVASPSPSFEDVAAIHGGVAAAQHTRPETQDQPHQQQSQQQSTLEHQSRPGQQLQRELQPSKQEDAQRLQSLQQHCVAGPTRGVKALKVGAAVAAAVAAPAVSDPAAPLAAEGGQLLTVRLPDGRLLQVTLPPEAAAAAAVPAEGIVLPASAAPVEAPAEATVTATSAVVVAEQAEPPPEAAAATTPAPAVAQAAGVEASQAAEVGRSAAVCKAKPPGPPPPCSKAPLGAPHAPDSQASAAAAAAGSSKAGVSSLKAKPPGLPPPGRPPAAAGRVAKSKAPGPPPPGSKAKATSKGSPPKGGFEGIPPPPLSKAAARLQQQASAEAALPLGRKIHWKALTDDKIDGTVFSEMTCVGPLSPSTLVDGGALSRLFSRAQPATAAAGAAAAKRPAKKPEPQQCLDSTGLSLELLERLEQICPQAEEVESFQEYIQRKKAQQASQSAAATDLEAGKPPASPGASTASPPNTAGVAAAGGPPLRDVEAAMLPLAMLGAVSLRIRILRFELNAPKTLKELHDALDLVDRAAEQARNSRKFRVLLQAVLQWGNYVNHGVRLVAAAETAQQQASGTAAAAEPAAAAAPSLEELPTRGFALPSLLKLMEFRSTVDSRLSSLHYILVNLMASLPDLKLEGLPEEMPLVEEASRLSDEALDAAATLLHRETHFLLQQIQQAKPGGGVWGPSELERLRRIHGEAALGFQGVRQRYATSKQRVSDLARFYGEEPQRLSATAAAAAAAVAAAAGEGWGGLMQASPFPTLAAILVTFKQTLRDIQQHPKRYAVLLANTNASSSKEAPADMPEGRGVSQVQGTAAAGVAAGRTAAAAQSPAAGATSAAASARRPYLHAQLIRKGSDSVSTSWGSPKDPSGGDGAATFFDRTLAPRRSSSCSNLRPQLQGFRQQAAAGLQQQQQRLIRPLEGQGEQPDSAVTQQPRRHKEAVTVRLPGSRVSTAAADAAGAARGEESSSAAAVAVVAAVAGGAMSSSAAISRRSNRASLHALLDEPSFPALDLAASINRALFVSELSTEEATLAACEPHTPAHVPSEESQQPLQQSPAAAASPGAVAAAFDGSQAFGKSSQQQQRPSANIPSLRGVCNSSRTGNGQFIPPRVLPRYSQQRQQQQQQHQPLFRQPQPPLRARRPPLRPRLPPPALSPRKAVRGCQGAGWSAPAGVHREDLESQQLQQPQQQHKQPS
ncbi:hypothetical protein ACSSS7_003984 [Eimeria intestinalis]